MKKLLFILFFSALLLGANAQNPFCDKKGNSNVGELMNFHYNTISNKGEGCSFRFVLWDPANAGWSSSNRISITVDGVDYGSVTLPWGTPSDEVIKLLPSGEVQFSWVGGFSHGRHCFEIYNSSNELIYESPFPGGLPEGVFLTYQNECCLPLTDFEGVYIPEAKQVNLSWTAPKSVDVTSFGIYRNNILIDHVATTTNFYSDNTANLEEGDYKYCVIPVYPFSCTFEEECFETYIIVGIASTTLSNQITVYPNPATHVINILGDEISEVRIYNNMGQLLFSQRNINVINVAGLTNGIYVLAVETSTGYTIHQKISIIR